MLNPYAAEQFAKERYNDLLREAAQARLVREALAAPGTRQTRIHLVARFFQRVWQTFRPGLTPPESVVLHRHEA